MPSRAGRNFFRAQKLTSGKHERAIKQNSTNIDEQNKSKSGKAGTLCEVKMRECTGGEKGRHL